MKKKLLSILMIMMFVIVSACSKGSDSQGTNSKEAEQSSGGGSDEAVELTWQMWGGDNDRAEWQKLADKVTETYPNIKVKLQIYDWGTYWTKLQTQLASETTSDIISMQSLQMPVYADKGALLSLKDYIATNPDIDFPDFNKVIIDGMSYKGEVYALPYDYGAVAIYYNKDLFDKYHVPYPDENMTWESFVDRAKKLTHSDKKEYGFAFNGGIWDAVPWIWQAGGEYLQSDGKYVINKPENITAFKFMSDLVNVHKVAPPMSDLATNGVGDRWQAGNIGMIIDGPWSLINYKKFAKFKFDVQVLPAGPTGKNTSLVAGSGFGISAKSKHKDEAWKAISVITSKESLGMLAKVGRAYPSRDSQVEKYNQASGIDNVQAFQKQGAEAKSFLTSPTWAQASQIIDQELQAVWFGKAEVGPTVQKIQGKLDEMK